MRRDSLGDEFATALQVAVHRQIVEDVEGEYRVRCAVHKMLLLLPALARLRIGARSWNLGTPPLEAALPTIAAVAFARRDQRISLRQSPASAIVSAVVLAIV